VDVDANAVLVEDDVAPPEAGDLADAPAGLEEDGDDRAIPNGEAPFEDSQDLVGCQEGIGRSRGVIDVRDLDRPDLLTVDG
jgi:hypothetical protein